MPKKLYRSANNKMLFGVCGGLGEYFDLDPNVVRIIFAVGFLMAGVTLLIYIIMFLILPYSPDNSNPPSQEPKK